MMPTTTSRDAITSVARGRWGAVLLALAIGACDPAAGMRGSVIDPPIDIPTFTFRGADGSAVSLAPEEGRPTVLFFGYTHCPDVCPTTLSDWRRAKSRLGDDADRVRWVFVTIDPERDTPEVAQRYAARFDSSFIGVSGDSATTVAIQRAFSVGATRAAPGPGAGEYDMMHTSQTFLVDDRGRWRALYSFNGGWQALAHDLERLL